MSSDEKKKERFLLIIVFAWVIAGNIVMLGFILLSRSDWWVRLVETAEATIAHGGKIVSGIGGAVWLLLFFALGQAGVWILEWAAGKRRID